MAAVILPTLVVPVPVSPKQPSTSASVRRVIVTALPPTAVGVLVVEYFRRSAVKWESPATLAAPRTT